MGDVEAGFDGELELAGHCAGVAAAELVGVGGLVAFAAGLADFVLDRCGDGFEFVWHGECGVGGVVAVAGLGDEVAGFVGGLGEVEDVDGLVGVVGAVAAFPGGVEVAGGFEAFGAGLGVGEGAECAGVDAGDEDAADGVAASVLVELDGVEVAGPVFEAGGFHGEAVLGFAGGGDLAGLAGGEDHVVWRSITVVVRAIGALVLRDISCQRQRRFSVGSGRRFVLNTRGFWPPLEVVPWREGVRRQRWDNCA